MAFGDEDVRPPPGELDWALDETEIQEPPHRGTWGCRGAGPRGAFRQGSPFSSGIAPL